MKGRVLLERTHPRGCADCICLSLCLSLCLSVRPSLCAFECTSSRPVFTTRFGYVRTSLLPDYQSLSYLVIALCPGVSPLTRLPVEASLRTTFMHTTHTTHTTHATPRKPCPRYGICHMPWLFHLHTFCLAVWLLGCLAVRSAWSAWTLVL